MTHTASTYRNEFWFALIGLATGLFIGLALASMQGGELNQPLGAATEVWLEQPDRFSPN